MQKQEHPISRSLPPSNQNSKKPSMASQEEGATPAGRSGGADDDDVRSHTDAENDPLLSSPPEDFEFCILSSGGLALAGDDAADNMCVADEVFSGGKLLPFRLSSADSSTSTSGFSSRSVSRSASSGSSSSCVSRSTSSKSASSDPARVASCPPGAAAGVPPRRSLSGSVFYAHPSPSPRRNEIDVHMF